MGRTRTPPLRTISPAVSIDGKAPIKSAKLLKDNRHLVCETTNSTVTIWDLAKVACVKQEEGKGLKEVADALNAKIREEKPSEAWCRVDIKLGVIPCIILIIVVNARIF